jgi:hypothetical protein
LTSNAGRAGIFAYETGSAMVGVNIAAGRRVGLFFKATTGVIGTLLNTTGQTLFNNAVAWASQPNFNLDCAGVCGGTAIRDCANVCYIAPALPPNTYGCDGVCRTRCSLNAFEDCAKTCKVCVQSGGVGRFRSKNAKPSKKAITVSGSQFMVSSANSPDRSDPNAPMCDHCGKRHRV